jgi:hypothetical protein
MVARGGLVLGLALMGAFDTEIAVSAQKIDSPTTVALNFFAGVIGRDIGSALRSMRPPQISPAERTHALAMLPGQGELTPNPAERRKLATVEGILKYHDRSNMETKVVDLPYAGIAIYQRAVLLVSRLALGLVSEAELQAAVAHEIGHEYFWAEYEQTHLSPANRQTIELKCDGIAALTLLALGLDVSRLNSAMSRIIRFNRSIGITTDEAGYPTLRERDIFVRTLLKMVHEA